MGSIPVKTHYLNLLEETSDKHRLRNIPHRDLLVLLENVRLGLILRKDRPRKGFRLKETKEIHSNEVHGYG